MKFELSKDTPQQHLLILVFAGAFIFLSIVEAIKAPTDDLMIKGPRDEGETLYQNPHMTWYERLLCRGYQRSSFCSYRLLHPFKAVFEENGIRIEERPAKTGVIRYRGPLPGHKTFGGKIVFDSDE